MPGVWCQQGRLREDSGLILSLPDARRICDHARDLGFARAGFVDPDNLARRGDVRRFQPPEDGMEWSWVTSPQDWRRRASILVCCLSCHRREPDDLSTPDDPHGLIAPFARRNYYTTATRLMHRLLVRLDEELGIPRASARIFCNSRLPEKPLCVAAGLASLATNGLCVAAGLGSLFVIAGAVIQRPFPEAAALGASAAHGECGSCRRCIDACPAGAITSAGVVDRSRCLAGLAARPDVLPPEIMEKWGARLYGCQDCQSVCPRNRELQEEAPDARGEIGPSVSLRWLLSLDPRRLEELFHGTAMGLSWISKEALLRNAVIAAGNRGAAALRESISSFADSGLQPIRAAARWAIQKIAGMEEMEETEESEKAERNEGLPDA